MSKPKDTNYSPPSNAKNIDKSYEIMEELRASVLTESTVKVGDQSNHLSCDNKQQQSLVSDDLRVSPLSDVVEGGGGSDMGNFSDEDGSSSNILSTAATVGSYRHSVGAKSSNGGVKPALDPFEESTMLEPVRWEEASNQQVILDTADPYSDNFASNNPDESHDVLPILDDPSQDDAILITGETPDMRSARDYAALPDTVTTSAQMVLPESAIGERKTDITVTGNSKSGTAKQKKSLTGFPGTKSSKPSGTLRKQQQETVALPLKSKSIKKTSSNLKSLDKRGASPRLKAVALDVISVDSVPEEILNLKNEIERLSSELSDSQKQLAMALQEKHKLSNRIAYLTESLEKEKTITNDLTDQLTRLLKAGNDSETDPNYKVLKGIGSVMEKEQIISTYSPGQVHQLALEIKEQETLMRGYQRENENQSKENKSLRAQIVDLQDKHANALESKTTEIAMLKTKILELEGMAAAAGESKILAETRKQLRSTQESLAQKTVELENLEAELRLAHKELQTKAATEIQAKGRDESEWKDREKQLLLDLMNERQKRDGAEKKLLALSLNAKEPQVPGPLPGDQESTGEPPSTLVSKEILSDILDSVMVSQSDEPIIIPSMERDESAEPVSYAKVAASSTVSKRDKGSARGRSKAPTSSSNVKKQQSSSEVTFPKKSGATDTESHLNDSDIVKLRNEIQRIQAASVKTEKSLTEMIDKLKADNAQLTKEKSGLSKELSDLERVNTEWSWEMKKLGQNIFPRLKRLQEKVDRISPHVIFNPLSLSLISLRTVIEGRVLTKMRQFQRQNHMRQGDLQKQVSQLELSKAELMQRHNADLESNYSKIGDLERELRSLRERVKGDEDDLKRAEETRIQLERERQITTSLREEMLRMEDRYKQMHDNTVDILRKAQEESTRLILQQKQPQEGGNNGIGIGGSSGSATDSSNVTDVQVMDKLRKELQEWRDDAIRWKQKYEDAMHWFESREGKHAKPVISEDPSKFPTPWMEQIKSLQESNQQLTLALSKVTSMAAATASNTATSTATTTSSTMTGNSSHISPDQVNNKIASNLSLSLVKSSYEQMIKSMKKQHEIEINWKDDQIRAFRNELDALVACLKSRLQGNGREE